MKGNVERYINYVVDNIINHITIDHRRKVILFNHHTLHARFGIPFFMIKVYKFNRVKWINNWLEGSFGIDKKVRKKVYKHLKKKIMGEVLSVSE